MKRLALSLLAVCAMAGPSCVSLPPPAPGSGRYAGAEEAAYRKGYHLGFQDGKYSRTSDHERYHDDYAAATESAFATGYRFGHEAATDQADARDDERKLSRELGYEAGNTDATNGLSPFYQRHRRDYTPATEYEFRDGYVIGYNQLRQDEDPLQVRRAYTDGYSQGEIDAEQGRPPHTAESFSDDVQISSAYAEGYRDGYARRVPKR